MGVHIACTGCCATLLMRIQIKRPTRPLPLFFPETFFPKNFTIERPPLPRLSIHKKREEKCTFQSL